MSEEDDDTAIISEGEGEEVLALFIYMCLYKCVCVGVNCVSKIISFKVHGFETLSPQL